MPKKKVKKKVTKKAAKKALDTMDLYKEGRQLIGPFFEALRKLDLDGDAYSELLAEVQNALDLATNGIYQDGTGY